MTVHCDIRFDQNEVVLNSKENGNWNPVEIKGMNPFTKGGIFEVSQKETQSCDHYFTLFYFFEI